jgi:hypothetical protein
VATDNLNRPLAVVTLKTVASDKVDVFSTVETSVLLLSDADRGTRVICDNCGNNGLALARLHMVIFS